MNKINEFKFLKTWCDEYYETVGLKIHPSNVPVDVVLDDLMGNFNALKGYASNILKIYDSLNFRVGELEEEILSLKNEIEHLKKDLIESCVASKQKKEAKKNDQ